ncbi:hypothetical protein ACFVS2_21110 [Brevibacillus sp. NPDC058079]|uniref:hypothetical protein n=1 Tax=Brevibacillus sp. NPDC058079 TaxID=3346330 RepID=UPI0036E51C70
MKGDSETRDSKNQNKRKSPYSGAFRDFIQQTIKDPSFFDLPPVEQKKVAKGVINKHKVVSYQQAATKKEARE